MLALRSKKAGLFLAQGRRAARSDLNESCGEAKRPEKTKER